MAYAAPRSSPSDYPDYTFRGTTCRMLIDEINIFTDKPSEKQYIKLSRYCDDTSAWVKSVDMKGFKLLFLAPDGYLIGSCSLDNTRLKERESIIYISEGNKRIKQVRKYWSYVIGSGVVDADMSRDACHLVPAGSKSNGLRFPLGVNYPVGLALIYNEKPKVIEVIKMNHDGNKYIRTAISTSVQSKIQKYLQDFYQYGSKTIFQTCDYFSLFFTYPTEPRILLRDWFIPDQTDFGLSRCSRDNIFKRNLPFQPQLFKYAIPSPNGPNKCSDAFAFSIDSLLPYRDVSNDVYLGDLTLPCHSLVEDVESSALGVITSDIRFRTQLTLAGTENRNMVEEIPRHADSSYSDSCNSILEVLDVNSDNEFVLNEDSESNAVARYQPNIIDQTSFEQSLESGVPYIWANNNCERLPQSVVDQVMLLDGTPINVKDLKRPEVCYWFQFIPETTKFVCKLCRKLFLQNIIFDRPNSQQIKQIMIDGIMDYHASNKWSNNRIKMLEHEQSVYHRLAKQWFALFDSGLRGEDIKHAFENKPGPFLSYIGSTRSMMAITKTAVEMGLSFYNFEKLTELIKYFGVDIGHLYRNSNGVRAMIESISNALHKDFVEYLSKHRPKFSVMLDGTSDVSSETVVAILFMIENPLGGTYIRLYKILHLPEGEKGDNVFEALKSQLEADNLESFFKEGLISITSDGGLNIYNVFNRRVSDYVGRDILKHWCDNHRENLLYRNTISQFPTLSSVAKIINRVHKMYNSKSPKNKACLRDVTVKAGGKPFECKKTHEIRWVSGNLRAFTTLFLNWKYIVKATEGIKNSAEFSRPTRNTALELLKDLTDITFVTHLAFLRDIGRFIGDMSLQVEKRGATLIAKKAMREQFLLILELMKTTSTESVTLLLSSAKITVDDVETNSPNSLEEFEQKSIALYGIPLHDANGNDKGFYLSENQNDYPDEFIAQTYFYFPADARDGFDIFNPQAFPSVVDPSNVYGLWKFQNLMLT